MLTPVSTGDFSRLVFDRTAAYIRRCQCEDGLIPWYANAPADPWNLVEAAMGLSIGGFLREAEAAYDWLARNQLPTGAWPAAFCSNHSPQDMEMQGEGHVETNFVAYMATGVWHHYLITGDRNFLRRFWGHVGKAIDFVLSLQTGAGVIPWAWHAHEEVGEDALLTGCCSIYKSIECALLMAEQLGEERHQWKMARARLGKALCLHPGHPDRISQGSRRHAMDWFYPVLARVIDTRHAWEHLRERWDDFVVEQRGCRCVRDRPWVTVAESCELVMALLVAGQRDLAAELFTCLHVYVDEDGGAWTGYVYEDSALWPLEKPTWTAGALLLAADALTGHTPASHLFTGAASW